MIIAQEIATPGATIYGFDSSDTIDPGQGAGGRLMSGGNGNDTYVFGEGYGNDTIFVNRDNPLGGMTDTVELNPEVGPAIFTSNIDTVRFNADVDPSAVTFTRGANPNDLVVTPRAG